MRAVDTNVLVRLIVRDDATHVAAAEAFIQTGGWVSILALAEAVWVLVTVYDRAAEDVTIAIEMLLNHRNLVLQDDDVVVGALDLFRSRPSLGYSDCLMLAMARRAGHLPLGTFDRKLGRVEGARTL